MRNTRLAIAKTTRQVIFTLMLAGLFLCARAAAQDRVFNWLPANDENVRLDPANYHTGRTYRPNAPGQSNHVDIRAEKPVTIFMTREGDWNQALQRPEMIGGLRQVCVQEHVTALTYTCEMPVEPMTLVIRDDRYSEDAAVSVVLAALKLRANWGKRREMRS